MDSSYLQDVLIRVWVSWRNMRKVESRAGEPEWNVQVNLLG